MFLSPCDTISHLSCLWRFVLEGYFLDNIFLKLSTNRGYHCIVHVFPHPWYQKCAGNICTFWADSKFVLATPTIMHIAMGIAEVMHLDKSLFQIHEKKENLEVTASIYERLSCCLNVHCLGQWHS